MHVKTWHVDLYISEDGDDTSARAVLRSDAPTHLEARGTARRMPLDSAVAEIGDEVAATRALDALVEKMLAATARDILAARQGSEHSQV